MIIRCSNTYCDGFTDRLGGLCQKCQEKADAQKRNRWRWAGWTRQEERNQQQRQKPRKDGEG